MQTSLVVRKFAERDSTCFPSLIVLTCKLSKILQVELCHQMLKEALSLMKMYAKMHRFKFK